MQTIRYRSRGSTVYFLEELLTRIGYEVYVSRYFGSDTHAAVMDFQSKNDLVVDGIVGPKTWSRLIEKRQEFLQYNNKFLSESDLIDFAQGYALELAAVKAVNEVESDGKGFLIDGRAKILFEGHIFWRQLKQRNIDPQSLSNNSNTDVLYKKWTKVYYLGGSGEYMRLEKATKIRDSKKVKEAAYCSASWGAFQIMGYHFRSLGYPSIDDFVKKMQQHEREHLRAFGKFLEVNGLIKPIRDKAWAKFALGYNGSGYKQNKYDEKLKKAYDKYKIQ